MHCGDMVVLGRTKEEHDHNFGAMLTWTREKGLRLNPDKCQVCVTEVSFFGHKLTVDGLKPDPLKVNAICGMQLPKNEAELETILSMVYCFARFAPNLAKMSAPLRHLL